MCVAAIRGEGDPPADYADCHARWLTRHLARYGYTADDLKTDWVAACVLVNLGELGPYSRETGSLAAEKRLADADAVAALSGRDSPIGRRYDMCNREHRLPAEVLCRHYFSEEV